MSRLSSCAPARARSFTAFLATCALGVCACGARPDSPPRTCAADADCAPDAHCRAGACLADLAPEARVAGPHTALTHVELSFDGSESRDPDDEILAFAWSVRSTSPTECAPDPGPTNEQSFHPLFPCAGEFEVTLVVRDRAGLASRPASVAISVAAQARNPPVLVAGADLDLAHRCEGSPISCFALDAGGDRNLRLQAQGAPSAGADAVTYRWDWVPPPGVVTGTTPPVTFVSGRDTASPLVTLATPGTAIAGRWVFTVTVTDAAGLSARASQAVVVRNRPPVAVGGQALSIPHAYDAVASLYRAGGALSASYSDPDGDPISTAWQFRESTASHCTFGRGPAGDGTFDLACADARELIGGVERSVELQVSDVNGATAVASWPLAIVNRPPVLSPVPATVTFDHRVDDALAPSAFLVQGTYAFVVSDPDGDPLPPVTLVPSVNAALAPHSSARPIVDGGGRPAFVFSTPLAYASEFRKADGSSAFSVKAQVADAWASAAPVSFAVGVGNRAPTPVGAVPSSVTLGHAYDGAAYVAGGPLAAFADPDGDPITIADAGSSATCRQLSLSRSTLSATASVGCRLEYTPSQGAPTLASFLAGQRVAYTIADPWGASTAAAADLQITDRPPTATVRAPAQVTLACTQDAYGTSHVAGSFTATASFSDPDGDPVSLSWWLPGNLMGSDAGGYLVPYTARCATDAGTCGTTTVDVLASRSFTPVDVQLTISDGAASIQTTTSAGLACGG